MRTFLLLTICTLLFCTPTLFAQVDTVVVQPDSSRISRFSRKLNYERRNLKYHMEERGNVREVFVFLSTLEELPSGRKTFAVRIDARGNRNIFTDAPLSATEYIDADELGGVIEFLDTAVNHIMNTDQNVHRYTEYRHYTRGGIMLELYTGLNRWRFCFNYKTGALGDTNVLTLDKLDNITYINRPEALRELLVLLQELQKEITVLQQQETVRRNQ